jgi:L-threonylcarbamoyladenylate synthase
LKKKQKKLNSSSKILAVDPVSPQADIINQASETVAKGGVVIFPTTCLYGLAADAMNEDAVRKVYEIKKRPPDNPILVLVKNQEALKKIAVSISTEAYRIMKIFWPGNITIILEAQDSMPAITTAGTGKIGIRIPAHNVAIELTKRLKNPLTATSANISNTTGCSKVSDISPEIIDQADLILDTGPLKGGVGSTIVDVTTTPPEILREGTIAAADILNCLDA